MLFLLNINSGCISDLPPYIAERVDVAFIARTWNLGEQRSIWRTLIAQRTRPSSSSSGNGGNGSCGRSDAKVVSGASNPDSKHLLSPSQQSHCEATTEATLSWEDFRAALQCIMAEEGAFFGHCQAGNDPWRITKQAVLVFTHDNHARSSRHVAVWQPRNVEMAQRSRSSITRFPVFRVEQ